MEKKNKKYLRLYDLVEYANKCGLKEIEFRLETGGYIYVAKVCKIENRTTPISVVLPFNLSSDEHYIFPANLIVLLP